MTAPDTIPAAETIPVPAPMAAETAGGIAARTSLVEKKMDVDHHVVMGKTSENMVAGGMISTGARQRRPAAKTEQPPRVMIEREYSDVNKSAEAFIQRFRQQLEIQRMESLEKLRMSTTGRGIRR